MSRFVALFLLVLVGFRSSGYLAFSLLRLHTVRVQARSGHSKRRNNRAERFVFSIGQFRELTNGSREFWHGGRLYDICQIQSAGDSLHISAHPDDRERALLAGFRPFFQQSREPAPLSGPLPWWVQILTQPFLPEQAFFLSGMALCEGKTALPCLPERLPESAAPDPFSPPPEC